MIASYLQAHHLTSNRILLLYPTGTEFITSLIGCWYAGAIAVPMPCPKTDEFAKQQTLLNSIAEDADIAAWLGLETYRSKIESTITRKVHVLATDCMHAPHAKTYQPIPITEDTIAYLQYTSWSTSNHKAAIISHGNLQHSLQATIKVWHYTKKSVTLTLAPHTHVYGLVCGLLVPLYHGDARAHYASCCIRQQTNFLVIGDCHISCHPQRLSQFRLRPLRTRYSGSRPCWP
ncbi:MAG: AMP-binding protein [Legionella sp.]